jgi:hypothetical protein
VEGEEKRCAKRVVAHSCSASRNLSCSGSVQISRDLVIVYGLRTLLAPSSSSSCSRSRASSFASPPPPPTPGIDESSGWGVVLMDTITSDSLLDGDRSAPKRNSGGTRRRCWRLRACVRALRKKRDDSRALSCPQVSTDTDPRVPTNHFAKKNSSRFVIGTRGLHSTDQQEHAAAPKRPF